MNFFYKLQTKDLNFNENQRKAISHINGPLLVAAGPGSGKTSVITARAAFLVLAGGISPSNILVVTFTRAAANEMKQRFKDFPGITPEHFNSVDFGTFHSTFYKIINSYYGIRLPVLTSAKAYNIVRNILRSLNEPFDDETIQKALNDISNATVTSNGPSSYKSAIFSSTKLTLIYNQYQDFKKSLKCLDFDDMMVQCKKILQSDSRLLEYYREKYKYIMVDEFQDSNKMQFDIIKLLSHPLNNLCVVGDDDQSIYGFRGSMPRCLIDFHEYYSPCKSVVLDINYRCTKQIMDFSKKVISHNISRVDKNLKPGRNMEGDCPILLNPPNEELEACFVADTVQELKANGSFYKDCAVLYRTNIQSRAFVDELIKRNIPFNIKDSFTNFFEHWACRDLICYLKLCLESDDFSSFSRILNRPVRYITRESIENAEMVFSAKGKGILESFETCGLKNFQQQHLNNLFENLKTLKYMAPARAINFIRKNMDYENYVRSYCLESNVDFEDLNVILNEFESSASAFKTISEFLSHIREISFKLKDTKASFKKDCITLSTIHSAKGLEFSTVFIIGAVEGFLPHKKSIQSGENVEEERRLFYVSITRAKDKLFICSPKRYQGKTAEVSRFVTEASDKGSSSEEIDIYKATLKPGKLISHKTFGTGKICNIFGDFIEILFNNSNGTKQLDLKTCQKKRLLETSDPKS